MSIHKKKVLTENDLIPGKCYQLVGCYQDGSYPPAMGMCVKELKDSFDFLYIGEAFLIVSPVMILSPRGLCKMPSWKTGYEVIEIPTKKKFL